MSEVSPLFEQTYQLIASHALMGEYDSQWRIKRGVKVAADKLIEFYLCDEGGKTRNVIDPDERTHQLNYIARINLWGAGLAQEYWLLDNGDVWFWDISGDQPKVSERRDASVLSEVLAAVSSD